MKHGYPRVLLVRSQIKHRTKTLLRSHRIAIQIACTGLCKIPDITLSSSLAWIQRARGSPSMSHQEQEQRLLYFDTSMSRNYMV